MRKSVRNSCAEPVIHNLNFKLVKDHDIFIDTKVDFKHCGNADGIDSSGRPYVLVAFPYWMTFEHKTATFLRSSHLMDSG